ncbi:MAG: DUF5107 domain-containing protein [Lachnospiraceae bacterium]|nr:DUF5107 domain-containing protein [Lachnospiraceae bacterium]
MIKVDLKREKQIIPTYVPKDPIKLPMFFEHKPYQGSTGRLYPLPFSDSISDEKADVSYDIFTIENEYIKTQIAPEIGGKILMGYDKLRDYNFIYHNEVVKPALVGLAGPWTSGGIEINWPQHHRPTTHMRLEAWAQDNADGSKTVWTGEVEPLSHMKGMAGITVAPGRSYIKLKAKIYNRTEQPQLFLWWANLAVPANDSYRTIFPPDVEWVNDHDRRCVMSWPIARGINHSARPFDFGDGTDISRFGAIKVPSSFLVSQEQSNMDFVAGYDCGKHSGIVSVANHHIAPGKKLWHWGKGEFGDMWCSNLTDKNGPYIELMTGVYTDNQPDFTWLAPYEAREFEQYWYPIFEIGGVKNATADAAVNVEERDGKLFIGFNVTGSYEEASVTVRYRGNTVFSDIADMSPAKAWIKEIPLGEMNLKGIKVSLTDRNGRVLVDYETYIRGQKQPIEVRKPVKRPSEYDSVEELYINGLHLEQYKQHNYRAEDYYLEALRRDPQDTRCNTAMARISLRNGNFEDCVRYAQKAEERLLSRNQHSPDVQFLYLKGVALKYLGRLDEAYDALYKAAWDHSFKSASYFELARIDSSRGEFEAALAKLDVALSFNTGFTGAKILKAALLRKLNRTNEAREITDQILNQDGLDITAWIELAHYEDVSDKIRDIFGSKSDCFVDPVSDYIKAGLYDDALFALEKCSGDYPLLGYYKAYCLEHTGHREEAEECCRKADSMDEGLCFPSRIDDIPVLKTASDLYPDGAKAYYYLGCLNYDKFNYDKAIGLWEKAISLAPTYAKAFRNLAFAYFDKKQDFLSAKDCMEKALEYMPGEPRLLMEYQQLLKNMDYSPQIRLGVYEKYDSLMQQRDDCYLDKLTLKSMTGEYREAIEMAKNRRFHIYEGGEGKLTKQHAWMHVLYGNKLAEEGRYGEAESMYLEGINMPKSYGEAKTFFNQEAHIYYYLGLLYEKKGESAAESYEKAAEYKAAVSEISLFRALACRKLRQYSQAREILEEMSETADAFIRDCDRRTYYSVGCPSPLPFEDDIVKNNLMSGYTLKAFALLGLGRWDEADGYIEKAKRIFCHNFTVYCYEMVKNRIMEL